MKFEKDYSIAYTQQRSDLWKSLETVVITTLMVFVVYKVFPGDPFSIKGPIPWICFVPVFYSLFYGSIYGILSLFILLLFLTIQLPIESLHGSIFREYLAGSVSLTLLAGAFSSYWIARTRHVEQLNQYVREHLDNLSRDYYLLRISHERIEQSYIIKPLSLRDMFYQLKQELIKNDCQINQSTSMTLLELFSQYCSINNAAYCFYDTETNQIKPIAFLGKEFAVKIDDPLIQNTISAKSSSYFAVNKLIKGNKSDYLAIIPQFKSMGEIMGFVIIKDIPFWSLTHDNMEVLTVLSAYFTLQWTTLNKVSPLLKEYPTCSSDFLNEFQSLVSLKKENSVDSAISCLMIPPGSQQQNITYLFEQQKRSLDYLWVHPVHSYNFVFTLMPLTSLSAMFGFRNRVEGLLKREFGLELNKDGLYIRYQQLNQIDPDKQLHDFIEEVTHVVE